MSNTLRQSGWSGMAFSPSQQNSRQPTMELDYGEARRKPTTGTGLA